MAAPRTHRCADITLAAGRLEADRDSPHRDNLADYHGQVRHRAAKLTGEQRQQGRLLLLSTPVINEHLGFPGAGRPVARHHLPRGGHRGTDAAVGHVQAPYHSLVDVPAEEIPIGILSQPGQIRRSAPADIEQPARYVVAGPPRSRHGCTSIVGRAAARLLTVVTGA